MKESLFIKNHSFFLCSTLLLEKVYRLTSSTDFAIGINMRKNPEVVLVLRSKRGFEVSFSEEAYATFLAYRSQIHKYFEDGTRPPDIVANNLVVKFFNVHQEKGVSFMHGTVCVCILEQATRYLLGLRHCVKNNVEYLNTKLSAVKSRVQKLADFVNTFQTIDMDESSIREKITNNDIFIKDSPIDCELTTIFLEVIIDLAHSQRYSYGSMLH